VIVRDRVRHHHRGQRIAVGASYSIDCSIHDPNYVSTLSQKDMTGKGMVKN
jgi:hypothetical protein